MAEVGSALALGALGFGVFVVVALRFLEASFLAAGAGAGAASSSSSTRMISSSSSSSSSSTSKPASLALSLSLSLSLPSRSISNSESTRSIAPSSSSLTTGVRFFLEDVPGVVVFCLFAPEAVFLVALLGVAFLATGDFAAAEGAASASFLAFLLGVGASSVAAAGEIKS